jgi:murein DD-endopeptidase MepM/ murein hydrolase activator NlpD
MKYRIKKYHGKFKHKLTEKYHVQLKKFRKWWDSFLDSGHEKMTVMLIPHDEKKIFNFQISKFTVSFFVFIFVMIIGTSSFAFIKNKAIKSEEQKLMMNYKDIRSHLYQFEKMTSNVSDLIDELKPDIQQIYELSSGPEADSKAIWEMDDFDKENIEELKKMKHILPEGIFTLKDIHRDIVASKNTIKTVETFVNARSKVTNRIPSIIPNPGHITSLFGWRRSPFGHGRDFHTGIDIAAAPNTPIRATAPGTISSAGWSGGYGYMVRISHEYGFETIYGHCQPNLPAFSGKTVKQGEIIGYVGQTGNATGNHCHYEIRLGNLPINPYPYMSRIW